MASVRTKTKTKLLHRWNRRNAPASDATSALEGGTSPVLQYPRRAKRKPPSKTFEQYEDDGAEAMYSASDDDFPFEEKVRAVMAETRPRRERWNSKTSSDKTSVIGRGISVPGATSSNRRTLHTPANITIVSQFRYCFLNSWTTMPPLILAAPVAIALHYRFGHDPSRGQSIAIFTLSVISITPLTALLTYAVEELAMYMGEVLGTVLNSLFSNAPQLVIGSFCLFENQTTVVKDIIVGSVLLNLLLELGACFFMGGINRMEQYFNVSTAQYTMQTLMLGVLIALFPSIFSRSMSDVKNLAELSHACAIISLTLFGAYLFLQLKTHTYLFNADNRSVKKRRNGQATERAGSTFQNDYDEAEDEDGLFPELTRTWAVFILCFSGTLIGFCSKALVDSIPRITESGAVPLRFIGFAIIPLAANLSDIATSVTVATLDKMDLSIGVIAGDCIHIILFTLPLLAIISWVANPGHFASESLSLRLDEPYSICLAICVFAVHQIIMDGKSHWLLGFFLISAYVLTVLGVWFSTPG